jgi:putative transposase
LEQASSPEVVAKGLDRTPVTNRQVQHSRCLRGGVVAELTLELWRSLKQEAVYLHEINDGFQAKRIIDDWIGFYNSERPHTALDKRTPDAAYFDQSETRKAA